MILNGIVQSGNEEDKINLFDYEIYLYGSLEDKAILLSEAISDEDGKFKLEIETIDIYFVYYIKCISKINKLKQLIHVFNNKLELNSSIIINELTSVASIYCFNQFLIDNDIYGNKMGLEIALGMKNNLVNLKGKLAEVISSNPNGDETNTKRLLNTLSNVYVYGIKSKPEDLLNLVIINNIENINLINLFNLIAKDPYQFIQNNLIQENDVFFVYSFVYKLYRPFLNYNEPPSSYTLAVKVNKTGNENLLFGGPANIVFDKNGYAWITNNVYQGTFNSSNFTIILQPNGQPASYSPIFDEKIVGSAYGIARYYDNILVSNFGWGNVVPNGGMAIINTENKNVSVINEEMFRVQGITVDKENNIWICSYGNSKIVVILNNQKIIKLDLEINNHPFDVICTNDNKIYVSVPSSQLISNIYKLSIINEKIIIDKIYNFETRNLLGMAFDSKNNIYVCSPLNSTVYQIISSTETIVSFNEGLYTPWGCSVDGDDNLWVANFGPNKRNKFCITKISPNGTLLTPVDGITLETGGKEVRLSTGEPLYGDIDVPCFNPLTRMTNCPIDMAGNVWAINNWKPSIINNQVIENSNPGGDGICIFIGIAGKLKNY
jgi:hypothetical protein